VVERSVYRCQDAEELIDEISIDPFDSPYRIKTKASAGETARSTDDNPGASDAKPAATVEFPIDLRTSIQDYEISLIKSALANCQFNQKKTADILGVTYHQLRGYLKKYDLLES
jgi:psp operon transcriptional activator